MKKPKDTWKVQKLGGSRVITIPAEFARKLGIAVGDKLAVGVNAERLIMRKVVDSDAETTNTD